MVNSFSRCNISTYTLSSLYALKVDSLREGISSASEDKITKITAWLLQSKFACFMAPEIEALAGKVHRLSTREEKAEISEVCDKVYQAVFKVYLASKLSIPMKDKEHKQILEDIFPLVKEAGHDLASEVVGLLSKKPLDELASIISLGHQMCDGIKDGFIKAYIFLKILKIPSSKKEVFFSCLHFLRNIPSGSVRYFLMDQIEKMDERGVEDFSRFATHAMWDLSLRKDALLLLEAFKAIDARDRKQVLDQLENFPLHTSSAAERAAFIFTLVSYPQPLAYPVVNAYSKLLPGLGSISSKALRALFAIAPLDLDDFVHLINLLIEKADNPTDKEQIVYYMEQWYTSQTASYLPGYEKISDLPPSKSRRTLSIHTPSKDYFLPVFYLGFFALENYRQLGFQSLKPELILLLSPLSPEERENLVVLFAPLHRPSFSEEASLNILKALVSLPADQKNTIVSLAKPLCLMVDRSQSIVNVVEALAQLQEEDRKQIQALLLSYCQAPFQYNLSDLIPILNQVPPNQREFLAHIARPLYQGLKCRASSGSLMATLANVMPRQRAKVVELALEWGSEFVFIEERYAMLSAAAKIWPIFSSDFRQCLLQQLQMRPGFYEKMDVLHQVMAIPHFKRDAVGLSVFLICSQVVSSKALSEIFDLFLPKKTIEPSMILFGKYLFEKEFPMDEKLTLLREIFIRIDHLKLNQVSVIEEIKAATQGWQLLEKWQSNR